MYHPPPFVPAPVPLWGPDQLGPRFGRRPLPGGFPGASAGFGDAFTDVFKQIGLNVAQIEASKARGEHYPTADLVASLSKTDIDGNASAALASSNGTAASLGVEVNMPLFAGFATTNRIKETAALITKSERDLDNARRSVALATRQAYFGVQSGHAQVKALEAAESSARLALEATQLGYRVGVRVNKDVLDAQTALSSTQKDLYKARYDVIVGTMKLRQASGSLKADDLDTLNKLLSR